MTATDQALCDFWRRLIEPFDGKMTINDVPVPHAVLGREGPPESRHGQAKGSH